MANETIKGEFYPAEGPEKAYWPPEQARARTFYRLLWTIGVLEALFAFVGNFLVMVDNGTPFKRTYALDTIVQHLALGFVCIGVAEAIRVMATRPID